MGRHQTRLGAGYIMCYALCRVTRHFLYVYLLIFHVDSQAQESSTPSVTSTTRRPPNLDTFITIAEIDKTKKAHMRFCDTDKPIYDDDIFCNRIIAITAHGDNDALGTGQIIVPGIFIDNRRILTSYTPFRNLRHVVPRDKIYIVYIIAKAYVKKEKLVGYFLGRIKLSCARQIVAMEHQYIVDEQWHGLDHTHTPMHDLMILQTENEMEFIKDGPYWHKFERNNVTYDVEEVGPMVTEIPKDDEEFPDTFKIISLGFMDNDHVFNKNHLHTSKEYELDDKVVEDCEEWFPRDWGYFICIKNDDDFVGIGSGGLLVSSNKDDKGTGKVFGIGCFMLKKNKASILVFTDIRPYLDAMSMTCNAWDGH